MMKQLCDEAIRLLEAGESFIQATVLTSSGSTPCSAGAFMLILEDGSIRGTAGGGALEGGIIKAAPEIMRLRSARVVDIVLDGSDDNAPDMICGGTASVLIDFISAGHPGNLGFFMALRSALRSGTRAQIITRQPVSGGGETRNQCLLTTNGPPLGAEGFSQEIIEALKNREGSYDAFTRLDGFGVWLHRIDSDGTAYIFGAGHCGEKLAHALYTIGFGTVVIDDRDEFANRDRFPEADEILIPESMDTPLLETEFGEDSYIVIVTRGHMQDELVLRGALRTGAGYIGMIGSKRKREAIYRNLLNDGYQQSDLDRVYSPIGLNIGAESPEEIAVSIAAEMIKVRAAQRSGRQELRTKAPGA